MLLLKYALLATGSILFLTGVLVVLLDAHRTWKLSQTIPPTEPWPPADAFRWGLASRLAVLASLALLPALGIVVVPSGMAGVRVSQIVAERLSDKVQMMMVPMDGKFFFANDVLRATPIAGMPMLPSDQRT